MAPGRHSQFPGDIAKTFSVTKLIDKRAAKFGRGLDEVPIGFKYICELMLEQNILIGGASGVKRMASLSAVEHAGIIRAFSELYHRVELLVIDTAAGLHESVMTFSQAAHHVLIVVCDEPASITDAYALIKVLSREHGVQRFQILANQTRRSGEGPDLFRKISRVCDRFLNVVLEFAGSVPFDNYLRRAVQRQTAVVDAYPASISSLALKNLALKADKWAVPQGARGHLEFFVERMVGARIGPSTVLQ